MRVVSLCRCIVARTILSVFTPQLAIKDSAEDPGDTVLDLPDRLGAKRVSLVVGVSCLLADLRICFHLGRLDVVSLELKY